MNKVFNKFKQKKKKKLKEKRKKNASEMSNKIKYFFDVSNTNGVLLKNKDFRVPKASEMSKNIKDVLLPFPDKKMVFGEKNGFRVPKDSEMSTKQSKIFV